MGGGNEFEIALKEGKSQILQSLTWREERRILRWNAVVRAAANMTGSAIVLGDSARGDQWQRD